MVILALLLLNYCSFDIGETPHPTSADIMHRVAVNQDREQKARNHFVYDQKVHRTIRNKDGKLLREEFWTYAVTPGPSGTEKKLSSVRGRYLKKGKYLPFEGEPVPDAEGLSLDFDDSSDNANRDGLNKDLFPLTTEEQTKYSFEMVGEQAVKGRPAYRIQFRPLDQREYRWTGEALIDKEEFQPVTVYTRLSRKLPFAVRTLLGTDVRGFGVNIQYTRVDKDLWFPASYGTEFALHALFFLNRTLAESMENTNFRRATVHSSIHFEDTADK